MSAIETSTAKNWTVGDLLDYFGPISLNRLRSNIPFGEATEEDVLHADDHEDRLCELVYGLLVEKTYDTYVSYFSTAFARDIHNFVHDRNLGIMFMGNGPVRILPQIVRMPTIVYISFDRLPKGELPREPIWAIPPNLIVEAFKRGNTERELQRKREEYFAGGTELVWEMNVFTKELIVYHSPGAGETLSAGDILTGGDVLPGYEIPVSRIFAEPIRKKSEN